MKDTRICLRSDDLLIRNAIAEFERGRELIERLDDLTYRTSANGTGSIGGHFRHNLDFLNNFLKGITERRIDYSARERDFRVEIDRSYAAERLRLALQRMHGVDDTILKQTVYVRSEIDHEAWLPSCIARELEFVNSHTVHHHALIAEKLSGFGIAVSGAFGVAPSTLDHWKTMAA